VRFAASCALGLILAAAPGPAHAALSSIEGIGYGAGGTVLFAAAAILFLFAIEKRRRMLALREAAHQASRRARLAATLAAMPGGYYRLTAEDKREVFSDGLCRLLGQTPNEMSSFGQLAHHFGTAEFTRLEQAVEGLRNAGVPFRLLLPTAHQERLLEVSGGLLPEAAARGLILWFHDITEHARDLANYAEKVKTAEEDTQHWHRLIEALDLPVWLRDETGALAWCNTAYARWVEARPEAVVREGLELAPEVAAEKAKSLAERVRATGQGAQEQRHLVVGGERRLIELAERPFGQGTLGFARDTTAVETATAELERHIEANKQVLESLSTAIDIYGADKRLIYFNSSFVKMFRLDEDWLKSQPIIGEMLDAMRERRRLPEQADFRAYKKQQIDLFTSLTEPREEMLHLPDGTAIRQVITPHPFGGLMFISEDVSGRLALERSYHTLSEVQRATLDHLYEGVAVFGGDGRLKLFNPVFARLWGLPEEVLAASPHIGDIVERTKELYDFGADWEGFKARLIARATQYERRVERIERRDGVVLDCAAVPLPDGAILATYLDITDSVNIERALRERNEALETADRLKSEFVANVSYELRTPLNTIIGFTEILDNEYFGALNERQSEYVKGVLESSQQLLNLINSILDLASIEAGHITLDLQSFEIAPMLKEMIALIDERARKQNFEVACDCPENIGTMLADERRIKQVLFNLLSNSLKFTPPGGRVSLGARRVDGEIALWVEDTGQGIGAAEQAHVFQRFFRGEGAGRQRSGAGLGLALVKSFVELHGGRVELDSAPERGTRVVCRFPETGVERRAASAS